MQQSGDAAAVIRVGSRGESGRGKWVGLELCFSCVCVCVWPKNRKGWQKIAPARV